MIDEQQDASEQPQEKLVLPGHADQPSGPTQAVRKIPMPYVPPLSSSKPFLSPVARLKYLWQRDPAYKVMMIAAAVLLIAGLIFGTLVTNMLFQWSAFVLRNGRVAVLPQQPPTGVTPQGTVDFHPTFPTPGGGQGGTDSSQPPMGPTPSLQNTPPPITPTPQPTATQQGGLLIVQITSIPTQVSNNSIVPVQVTTNEPGILVRLYVSYNVPPNFYASRVQMTDGNGNATLSWIVNVFTFARRRATARVVAVGQDQNGQQVSSQAFTVQIVG